MADLSDEQLQVRDDRRGKPRTLTLQPVGSGLQIGEPVLTSLVGDHGILAAAAHVDGLDGHPGQHSLGRVCYGANDARRLLSQDLAAAAKTIRPRLPVVLASGYAELSGSSATNLTRLAKPFTQLELSDAIGQAIKDCVQ